MQRAIDIDALPALAGGAAVAILRSKWHADVIDGLHAKCEAVLRRKGVGDIRTHALPGSFEFPYAANELALTATDLDAIICLGVVLKGDTCHFEMIVDECGRGLGAVSRRCRIPIINAVLPVTDIAQARARARDDEYNKGIEAAAAAIEIIHWRRGL